MLREESSKKKRRHPPDIKINLLPRLGITQGQTGMTRVARDAGLSRESLYKVLSGETTLPLKADFQQFLEEYDESERKTEIEKVFCFF
jgi:hypothetical protein